MGVNTWNAFRCAINESLVRGLADAMATRGSPTLREAGYEYLIIDDCWQGERDAVTGEIVANVSRFPSGMAAMAAYVHGRGLRFGLYSDVGAHTCAGRPGALGHEALDAATYAKWGVDYLKVDFCDASTEDPVAHYRTISRALGDVATRRIFLAACSWGRGSPWTWGSTVNADSWRTGPDVLPFWSATTKAAVAPTYVAAQDGGEAGRRLATTHAVLQAADRVAGLGRYAGPAVGWNDPDMLVVGVDGMTAEDSPPPGARRWGGLTRPQAASHLALWAVVAAPLILGADVSALPADLHALITNPGLLAVARDPGGVPGRVIWTASMRDWAAGRPSRASVDGDVDVWVRPLTGGRGSNGGLGTEYAVLAVNRDAQRALTLDGPPWEALLLARAVADGSGSTVAGWCGTNGSAVAAPTSTAMPLALTDVWTGQETAATSAERWSPRLPPGGCAFVRVAIGGSSDSAAAAAARRHAHRVAAAGAMFVGALLVAAVGAAAVTIAVIRGGGPTGATRTPGAAATDASGGRELSPAHGEVVPFLAGAPRANGGGRAEPQDTPCQADGEGEGVFR
ncbi:hypothetical protein MMPV_001615 [Pyropia vietnamensis]